jgi:hypothetical protein
MAVSFQPVVDESLCRAIGELPKCPKCNAIACPNLLMFDDWL